MSSVCLPLLLSTSSVTYVLLCRRHISVLSIEPMNLITVPLLTLFLTLAHCIAHPFSSQMRTQRRSSMLTRQSSTPPPICKDFSNSAIPPRSFQSTPPHAHSINVAQLHVHSSVVRSFVVGAFSMKQAACRNRITRDAALQGCRTCFAEGQRRVGVRGDPRTMFSASYQLKAFIKSLKRRCVN